MADSLASQIITAIGGPENVRSLTHCATRLRFELADADGAAVIGATIVAEESMPSMGHGGGGTPSVSEVGDGVYDVDGVVFSMAGFWEVTLDISSDGVSDTITLQYDVE